MIAQLGAVEGAIELKQWGEATAYFERAKRLARFSLAEARASVHALRPETNAGPLRRRLERMVSAMTRGTALDSFVRERGTPVELSLNAAWCAYKFVQESLANAVKHSGANQFVVELEWDATRLKMCAMDNGCGFASDKVRKGLGFLSMRERAGEVGGDLRHEAQPGGGTRLCLDLPLPTKDERAKLLVPGCSRRDPKGHPVPFDSISSGILKTTVLVEVLRVSRPLLAQQVATIHSVVKAR